MFDVVTVGTATRDAFVRSKEFFVEREGHILGGRELAMPLGAKIEVEKIIFSTGGGAANCAATFARQGLSTAIVAAVGDDVSGRAVAEDLAREGVSCQFLRKVRNAATAYSILLHPESGGERTVLVYRGASENLRERDILRVKPLARFFYVSSLAGDISLLKTIVLYAKKIGAVIAYNPGGKELRQKKALLPVISKIDIVIANREEAAEITGIPHKYADKLFDRWDDLSPGINVMTDARKGVWVSDGVRRYRAGIYKEKRVADRTGAGDAFASGFVAGLIKSLRRERTNSLAVLRAPDISYAIRLGSANATSKVEGIGAKFGLLRAGQFEREPRWRKLVVSVKPIRR